MNNSKPSQDRNQSSSDWLPPSLEKKLRVEKVHGGENVEEVENVVLINEPDCPHTSMTLDPTETDFIAYVCDNPKCAMVKLYNK